tara:strand:+ start:156 stop:809 length:654 start_codon:yes stop_codon:yes gene_type:complete
MVGQLNFNEIMTLEKKSYKEIQAYLLNSLIIIKDENSYRYTPIKECETPVFGSDSCVWNCHTPLYSQAVVSKVKLRKSYFKDTLWRNYKLLLDQESTFAKNYNKKTETAEYFINLSTSYWWANSNCLDEYRFMGKRGCLSIGITAPDSYYWERFKKSVMKTATFNGTSRFNENEPLRVEYVIKRYIENGYWYGVSISLEEVDGGGGYAYITFDISVD